MYGSGGLGKAVGVIQFDVSPQNWPGIWNSADFQSPAAKSQDNAENAVSICTGTSSDRLYAEGLG